MKEIEKSNDEEMGKGEIIPCINLNVIDSWKIFL